MSKEPTHPTGAREALEPAEILANLYAEFHCRQQGKVYCVTLGESQMEEIRLSLEKSVEDEDRRAQAGAQTGAPVENCGFCCEQDDVGEDGKCRCGCHEDPQRTALLVCIAALKKVRLKIANWEKEYDEALKMAISALTTQGTGGMPQAHQTDHKFEPDGDNVSDCGICGWEGRNAEGQE
jgi:hypothetical protein